MPHTRDDVLATIRDTFPESSGPGVLGLLDTYGIESHERERDRVQLAILQLSEGNEARLREFLAVAKRDYRDVLVWVEYPEESKIDTPEKRRKSAEAVREAWPRPAGRLVGMTEAQVHKCSAP